MSQEQPPVPPSPREQPPVPPPPREMSNAQATLYTGFVKTSELLHKEELDLVERANQAMMLFTNTTNMLILFSASAYAYFGQVSRCTAAVYVSYVLAIPFTLALIMSSCMAFGSLRIVEGLMEEVSRRKEALRKSVKNFMAKHFPQEATSSYSPPTVPAPTATAGGVQPEGLSDVEQPNTPTQNEPLLSRAASELARQSALYDQLLSLRDKLKIKDQMHSNLAYYRLALGFITGAIGVYCLAMPVFAYYFVCGGAGGGLTSPFAEAPTCSPT